MRDASRAKNSTAKAGHGKNPPGLLSSRPPAAEDDTGRAMASETAPRAPCSAEPKRPALHSGRKTHEQRPGMEQIRPAFCRQRPRPPETTRSAQALRKQLPALPALRQKSIAARRRLLRKKGRTRFVSRRPEPPPTWSTAVVSSRPRPEGRRHMPAPRGAGNALFPAGGTTAALFSTHGRERLFRNAAGQADAASLSAHGAEGKGHGGSGSGRGIHLQLSLVHLDDVA